MYNSDMKYLKIAGILLGAQIISYLLFFYLAVNLLSDCKLTGTIAFSCSASGNPLLPAQFALLCIPPVATKLLTDRLKLKTSWARIIILHLFLLALAFGALLLYIALTTHPAA